jgi:hypothetical protein
MDKKPDLLSCFVEPVAINNIYHINKDHDGKEKSLPSWSLFFGGNIRLLLSHFLNFSSVKDCHEKAVLQVYYYRNTEGGSASHGFNFIRRRNLNDRFKDL